MLFGSKKVIGLDIGSTSIKVAELNYSKSSATLVNFAMIPTPTHAISGGDIVDAGILSSTIKGLLTKIGTRRKNAAIGLWGSSVIVKRITIPRIEEKMVAEQIRWEAEQYINFDLNDVHLDFQVLKSNTSAETMDVLLVAALKDMIFKQIEVVQGAGLTCAVVDVAGFALENCFEYNYRDAMGLTTLILNVGTNVTNFIVCINGDVIFSRDIPVGGLNYTSDIHKSMGISMEEAEALKISACMGQASPDEVTSMIAQTNEQLVEEIRNSFDFYSNAGGAQSTIAAIYLTGGASRAPNLSQGIANSLNLRVEPFDPFTAIKIGNKKLDQNYLAEVRDFAAIAIGLGLREGEK